MKRLGVAVIGAGFWGSNQARIIAELEDARLVAVHDISPEAATRLGVKYNVEWYSDLGSILSRKDIDAVTICSPTTTHYDVATKAIEAGKHVLVEKPMTSTSTEALNLIKLAKEKDVRLMPGHVERFNPAVTAVKSIIRDNRVGDIILVLARRVTRWPERIGDVGVIRDTAIHDIDVMRYILGEEVKSVYARVGRLKHKHEDYAEIMLHFRNGATGFIDANWLTPRKIRSLIITGSEATVTLDYLKQEIQIEDSEKLVKPPVAWQEPLRLELAHFVDMIIKTQEPIVGGVDALKAIQVCEATIESSNFGKTVYVP